MSLFKWFTSTERTLSEDEIANNIEDIILPAASIVDKDKISKLGGKTLRRELENVNFLIKWSTFWNPYKREIEYNIRERNKMFKDEALRTRFKNILKGKGYMVKEEFFWTGDIVIISIKWE